MSFATFEGNGFRHKAGRLGLASEEFPEREKGSKIRETSGFYRVLLGKPVAEGHFEKLWGDFPCGVNPESRGG